MSRDLRLEYFGNEDDSVEKLRDKLQLNVEKTQLILDGLTGITNEVWTPIPRSSRSDGGSRVNRPGATNDPVTTDSPDLGDEIRIGNGLIRWNVLGWLEYKCQSNWLKLPRGTPLNGMIPMWLDAHGGPIWVASTSTGNWRVVSTDDTIRSTDYVLRADATDDPFTLTLPNPASAPEQSFYVKKIDLTANKITVDGGIYYIDSALTKILTIPHQCICFHSITTAWELLMGYP